jgi:HAMP domain-containing protein
MIIGKLSTSAAAIYAASATVASLWWASDLSRRVQTIEQSTVTAERLARVETEVRALAQATRDLRTSVDGLAGNLKRR